LLVFYDDNSAGWLLHCASVLCVTLPCTKLCASNVVLLCVVVAFSVYVCTSQIVVQ